MKTSSLTYINSITTLFLISLIINGCKNNAQISQPKFSEAQLLQLEQQNILLNDIEEFVQASLFAGMIQVRKNNRQAWNKLLSVYACGAKNSAQQVISLIAKMQTDFQKTMRSSSVQLEVFVLENELAMLDDVSQVAFRLFTATYARGYAKQIALADKIQSGTQSDFCGGQIYTLPFDLNAFSQNQIWLANDEFNGLTKQVLTPHLKHGITAFSARLRQQEKLFEALVYSHAYQRTDEYQLLFFEVNKFENVESYGFSVQNASQSEDIYKTLEGHNDFAYLVLTSGYHWGMMSVLAILEQDYSDLHDQKKELSEKLIEEVVLEIK